MDYKFLLYEAKDRIATITLNRPERLNALNYELVDEIAAALDQASADNEVRVIIMKGKGRAFCAGFDIHEGVSTQSNVGYKANIYDERQRIIGRARKQYLHFWDVPKPVIVQVHGYCFGMASVYCCTADMVIIADDTQVGPPVMTTGGAGDLPPFIAWKCGIRKAKEWAYMPQTRWTGKECADNGFANKAVPLERLEETVQSMAGEIARQPLQILTLQKESINYMWELGGFRNHLARASEWDAVGHFTPDGLAMQKLIMEKGWKEAGRIMYGKDLK